jgi:hypothetical protein
MAMEFCLVEAELADDAGLIGGAAWRRANDARTDKVDTTG